jgi:hypothetical protein
MSRKDTLEERNLPELDKDFCILFIAMFMRVEMQLKSERI